MAIDSSTIVQRHEILIEAERLGFALSETLELMLSEHYSHRTERRGSGYTQATRLLADHINTPIDHMECGFDAQLLADPAGWRGRLRALRQQVCDATDSVANARDLAMLHQLVDAVRAPESKLLAEMLVDTLLRPKPSAHVLQPITIEKLKIGTCPLAEQFFLEIAHGFVRRGGRMNVLHDNGVAVLIEKRGLGDDHSCISLVPVYINHVRIPPGAMIGVSYDDSEILCAPKTRSGRGQWISLAQIQVFRFLRLTTLAVAPADRARAFSTHFQQQIQGGLFSPDSTTLDDLRERCRVERV